MASTTSIFLRMSVITLICLAALNVVSASDPDPLQDFCVADLSANAPRVNGYPCKARANVTASDFVFTGFRQIASKLSDSPTGATANFAADTTFPALNTQGVAHARLDFAVGGVIPLHTHPLAAETLLVLKGSIYTSFISNDNTLYASTLQQGDFTIFPKATQHFQINVGNETAITFNTLTSQHPGLFFTANQVFVPDIPSAVIEKSYGISAKMVKEIRNSVPRYWG